MKEQKLITLSSRENKYDNFFNYPGSYGSLQGYLETGWIVKEMEVDKENQRGWVLLERPKTDTPEPLMR